MRMNYIRTTGAVFHPKKCWSMQRNYSLIAKPINEEPAPRWPLNNTIDRVRYSMSKRRSEARRQSCSLCKLRHMDGRVEAASTSSLIQKGSSRRAPCLTSHQLVWGILEVGLGRGRPTRCLCKEGKYGRALLVNSCLFERFES